ncbi:MAG: Nif11-like leader peptide family natural product precursor [Peptostreptococcaceae bacterium]|nr:Nif11-like leader peptide family natural product precursor [Peptostreptococcaceae bacterium]
MTEIERFNKDALGNQEFMNELKNKGNDIKKIVAYANAEGYAFSLKDLEDEANESSVLSEKELDTVSGGVTVVAGAALQISPEKGLELAMGINAILVL